MIDLPLWGSQRMLGIWDSLGTGNILVQPRLGSSGPKGPWSSPLGSETLTTLLKSQDLLLPTHFDTQMSIVQPKGYLLLT